MKKTKIQHRKKILFIHHGTGIGGASLSLLYLVQSLDQKLYKPVVLFMQDSAAVQMFLSHNIEVVGPIGFSDFSHTKIWWYRWYHPHHLFKAVWHSLLLLAWVAKFWLEKIRPDIVHLNTSSLFAWAIVARRQKISVAWHIREPLAPGYLGLRKSFFTWVVGRFASKILPICRDNAAPWKDNPKVTVVYNAVPPEKFFCSSAKIFAQPSVLFLGGLSQEKGTLLLLESWKMVLKCLPEARLTIAGTWVPKTGIFAGWLPVTAWHRYCRKVLKLLETPNLNVEILGVSRAVPHLIEQHTLLVFPATEGHFARPVIEAGFMHRPVVATDLAPIRELLLEKKTGLLALPNNPEDLAEKILTVLMSPDLATQLGKNALEYCQKKFSLIQQQKLLAKIYHELCKFDA